MDKAKETYEVVLKIFANRNCIFSLENLRAILIEVYEILFRSIRVRRTWATHESVKGGTLQGNTTALIDERIKNVLDNYFDKFAPPNIRTKTDLAVTKHKQRPLPYCSEQLILW